MKFTVDTDAKCLTIEKELTFQELKAFINTLPVEWAAYRLVIKEAKGPNWPFIPSGPIYRGFDPNEVTVSTTAEQRTMKGVDWGNQEELPIDIRPVPGAPEPKNV